MHKFKFSVAATLCLLALLATTTTWAQTAAPKPSSSQQWLQNLKAKQSERAQDRTAQPRKAKATNTAEASNEDAALKAKKEAANATKATRKAKPYVPTEADKKAMAEKKAKLGDKVTAKTTATKVKTTAAKATPLTPAQRLEQVEKDLAYIQNTGKGTEKRAKLEAEQADLYGNQLNHAKTNEAKKSILQQWLNATTDANTKVRIQAMLTEIK